MAKRKCLNKRLSGYSRYSAGSAILNSDTDILGDEYPYWWKDLDNNSIQRPSIDSNLLNQTSRQLDSTSKIEISQVSDEWWKVLEVSNVPNSSKMNIDNMQKDPNIVSMSESEEESRIVKKKYPLRSKARKNKSNIFLNVLNDSETTTYKKTKGESSTNISASNSKTITNAEQINEIQESSLNQSEDSNVLKLKPNIYKKNYKNRNKNVFIDVLKANQSETSLKRKISSNSEVQIITKSTDCATIEDAVLSQPVQIQFPLSFENENNFSPFPPPKAQSTILEDSTSSGCKSNKESINSNTAYDILKPKSKLLMHNHKSTKKNLFENIFEKEESLNKIQKGATANDILKHSLNSSKTSTATANTMNELQCGHIKEIKTLSTSKVDARKISEDSTTSSGESDINPNNPTVQRFKSKFLTRLRKNRKKNPFQDIFEETNNENTLIAPPSERTLIRSTEKSSTIKNPTSTQGIFKRKDNQMPSDESVNLRLESRSESSNEEDVTLSVKGDRFNTNVINKSSGKDIKMKQPYLPTTETKLDEIENVSKKQSINVNNSSKQSLLQRSDSPAVADTVAIESTATKDKPKKRSSRLSKLQTSLLGSINESKRQEGKSISQRKSKRLSNKEKELVSPVMNEDEPSKTQNISKRQSKRLSWLQRRSSVQSMSEREDDNVESVSQRSTRSSIRIQEQLDSPVAEANESTKVQDTPQSQGQRLNNSSKLSSLYSTSKQELEDSENRPQRNVRSLSRVRKQSVSVAAQTDDSTKVQDTSQTQGKRSSNLSKLSSLYSTSKQELEDSENTSQRNVRSLSRVRKQSVSAAAQTDDSTKVQDTSQTQDKRSSNLSKLSSLHSTSKQGLEDSENTPQRNVRSLSRMRKQAVSPVADEDEPTKIQDTSKRQRKRSSNLSKQISLHSTSKQELEDLKSTSRLSIRLSRVEEQAASPAADEDEPTKIQDTSKRQRKRSSNLSKQISLHSTSKQELEDLKSMSRLSIRLSRVEEQAVSPAADEDEPTKIQDTSKRQRKRSSNLLKHLSLHSTSKERLEDTENTPRRSIRSLSRVKEQSVPAVVDANETTKTQNTSEVQRKRLSNLSKHLSLHSTSKERLQDTENTPRRSIRSLSRVQEQSVPAVVDANESTKTQNTSEVQRKRLSNLSKHLSMHSTSKERLQDTENTPRRSIRSLSRVQEQSVPAVVDADESTKSQNTSKDPGNSSSKLGKYRRPRRTTVQKGGDAKITPQRTSKRSNRVQEHSPSPVAGMDERMKDVSKTRSKSLSKVSKSLVYSSEEEEDDVESTPRKSTRNSSRVQTRLVAEANEEIHDIPEERGKRTSKSLHSTSKRERHSEEKSIPRKNTRSMSRIRKTSASFATEVDKLSEIDGTSKNRIEISDRASKRSSSPFTNMEDLEDGEIYVHHRIGSLSRIQDDRAEVQSTKDISNSRSNRSSTLQKFSVSHTGADTIKESIKDSTAKHEDNANKATRQVEVVVTNISSRQSNIFDEARKRTHPFNWSDTSSELEMGEIACRPKQRKKMHLGDLSGGKSHPDKNEENTRQQLVNDRFAISEDQPISSSTNKSNASSNKVDRNLNSLNGLVEGNDATKRLDNQFASDSSISSYNKDRNTMNFETENLTGGKESVSNAFRNEEIENRSQRADKVQDSVEKSFRASTPYLSTSKGQKIGENRKGASSKSKNLTSSVIRTSLGTESNVAKRQQSIRNFLVSDKTLPASQVAGNKKKIEEVKRELEKMKMLEIANTKVNEKKREIKPVALQKNVAGKGKKSTSQKQRLTKPTKPIHKAFLVNGQVYKVRRLPRPQRWVTDRLHNYLCKRLEPKYKLETKAISERFIHQLSNITTFIGKCKSYLHYKSELYALMKEMARLGIIHTRNDFYNFCHDFFPYSLRVKTVPMLLPGNKRNIPYDANKLHKPLADS